MTPATLNLSMVAGATFGPVTMTFKDGDGNPINLTGWSVWAEARIHATVINLAPTITDAAGGVVTISMTDEQTSLFEANQLNWDIMLENPSGERHGPYIKGTLTITRAVTQPT